MCNLFIVYATTVRLDSLGCIGVLDHPCRRSIASVRRKHPVDNDEVRRPVLDADSGPLSEAVALHRWPGHVFRMPVHRLSFGAIFARSGQGWKNQRRG